MSILRQRIEYKGNKQDSVYGVFELWLLARLILIVRRWTSQIQQHISQTLPIISGAPKFWVRQLTFQRQLMGLCLYFLLLCRHDCAVLLVIPFCEVAVEVQNVDVFL